jgi:dihydropteroate synthase
MDPSMFGSLDSSTIATGHREFGCSQQRPVRSDHSANHSHLRVGPMYPNITNPLRLPRADRSRPHKAPNCVIMGILNVTPDSFSDGGLYATTRAAVEHGLALWRDGADIVDIGGESTRPGAGRISAEDELARVIPAIRELVALGVRTSIDTTRAQVAQAAIDNGVCVVNDVSGGATDVRMARVIADANVPFVVMHRRGVSLDMHAQAHYDDVVVEVVRELRHRVEHLITAGVRATQLVLDPGLGFAKNAAQSWELVDRLDELTSGALPVLVGASRKSFLRTLPGLKRLDAAQLDGASAAVSALCVSRGATALRVHDVRTTLDALSSRHDTVDRSSIAEPL